MCEKKFETEQNCNILTPTLLAIIAFLSRSPGLLNWGLVFSISSYLQLVWSPTDLICNYSIGGLRVHSARWWLSLPHLVSNWLNFLYTELYNSSTSTFFLWTSQIGLIQPVHDQGYVLIFLERMHLLFTQVHFLFWQPGRVVGQYITEISCTEFNGFEYFYFILIIHTRFFLIIIIIIMMMMIHEDQATIGHKSPNVGLLIPTRRQDRVIIQGKKKKKIGLAE